MVSFEIFVKAMPPSLSELKVLPSFCFPIKIRDYRAVTRVHKVIWICLKMYIQKKYIFCPILRLTFGDGCQNYLIYKVRYIWMVPTANSGYTLLVFHRISIVKDMLFCMDFSCFSCKYLIKGIKYIYLRSLQPFIQTVKGQNTF